MQILDIRETTCAIASPLPVASVVMSAGAVIDGGVVSTTVIELVALAVLPD